MTGRELCPCYACEQQVCVGWSVDGIDALLHPSIRPDEEFGPNGETGCAAFDALDALEDFIAYLQKCQEALERGRKS